MDYFGFVPRNEKMMEIKYLCMPQRLDQSGTDNCEF